MERRVNSGEALNAEKTLMLRRGSRRFGVNPQSGYPKATLYYGDKIVDQAVAQPVAENRYRAIVTVPRYEGSEPIEMSLLWEVIDANGNEYQWEDTVLLDNHQRQAELKEPVILTSDEELSFHIPRRLSGTDTCRLIINDDKGQGQGQTYTGTIRPFTDRSELTFKIQKQPASLRPRIAVIEFTDGSQTHRTTSNYWVVNPSILMHANRLQSWLDKGRVENVVPELRFEISDMLTYLSNGLDTLNSYGSILTSFSGLNMTGVLSDLWQLCSAWYMCRAQYLAEGMMTFDFNGQAVTLSVDRAQYWDSMASTLESQMQERVPKAKSLLGRSGITGGDGNLDNVQNLGQRVGYLGLTRTPITDLRNFYY